MDESEFPRELVEEEAEPQPERHYESLYKQIMDMPINEKIRLATIGNREARGLLIKDQNRIVMQAVINSPKLTEEEVIKFAGNRNLPGEVVQLIAGKKELLKSYQVKLSLVSNAKTPVPTALRLLALLRESDLRHLAKDKNVSSVISRAALRMMEGRQAR
jgi:hypothetical protein